MNVDPLGNNPHERMTLTFAGIERAEHVVITVSGAAKASALARVMAGDVSAPAALLRGADVLWIVDRAALDQSVSR
jgi:6-phosphogluconolactonase/glucosamine-6-phosphate isomerase/deaminase